MEINSADVGYVRAVMDIETSGDAFEGHSREGAVGDILGWWDLLLAKLFTDYFERGALLHLKNGHSSSGDSVQVDAILHSALGPMRLKGTVGDGVLRGTLTQRMKPRGDITGTRSAPRLPLDDYPALIDSALGITAERIYNKRVLDGSEWRDFSDDIRELAGRAGDDIDILFGFFRYAESLPFSHYHIFQKSPRPSTWSAEEGDSTARIELKSISPATAYLKIASFVGEPKEIDDIFTEILSLNPGNLIIDLRGNSGGNISAMKVASYLADTTLYGGIFLTSRWFENHSSPPSVDRYDEFPILTEANVDLLVGGIHREKGVCLKVVPEDRSYRGKVFVLVDRHTASSCEPLVYGIKQYSLGTIVGERTAGAMLNGEEFPLRGNWYVTIPTAEYYAADGFRIDGVGVEPDIHAEPRLALDHVLTMLGEEM